jgi:hypothetical protein
MEVRLFRPLKLAGVHGDRWTVRLGISTSGVPLGAWLGAWGFALAAAQKVRHQVERIRAQGAGDHDEFHDIEPALAAFIFGDKGLRFIQATGEGVLGQPGGLARPDHKLAEGGLVGRMDGFADTAGG